VALLAAMAADLGNGNAVDANGGQGSFYLVQSERLDDSFNFLHTFRQRGS